MQEEWKDPQQLQELQELLPEFISQRPPMESNPCSADSSSQPGPLAWIVPCNSRAAVPGLGISCSEHRGRWFSVSPVTMPSFGRLGCPCPAWLCALLSFPSGSSSQPCCHSYVAPGTMWEPRQGDESWRGRNYFCQINKLINLPFSLQV